MPGSGRVPRRGVTYEEGWAEATRAFPESQARDRHASPGGAGVPGRRTVTITGQGAEGYATRNGTRPSAAARHTQLKRHERAGFRPDRAAMWAVLLGVLLMLAAVTSAHAASLVAHHVSSLAALRPR